VATLVMELGLIWLILLPRRFRVALFYLVTLWEIGVIASANYAFLNYLVLSLGILLVDDRFCLRWIPWRWRDRVKAALRATHGAGATDTPHSDAAPGFMRRQLAAIKLAIAAVMLTWIFYATTAQLLLMLLPRLPLPQTPIAMLDPFRVANRYGLFAVMTRGRYEIEFQGSNDGQTWIAYPFRYKPQALNQKPGIYAPYQPRFDWNLWFASLGSWRENAIVPNTEVRLLGNDADVIALFRENPFPGAPPKQIRALLWQYWFTTISEKRVTGNWWRRKLLGLYAPTLALQPDGNIAVVDMPEESGPRQ
jgi:hypothetical protein